MLTHKLNQLRRIVNNLDIDEDDKENMFNLIDDVEEGIIYSKQYVDEYDEEYNYPDEY